MEVVAEGGKSGSRSQIRTEIPAKRFLPDHHHHHHNNTLTNNSGRVSASFKNLIGSVTPVRTIIGQQQQLQLEEQQTMAKSSGLSIVHVTLPQSVIQSPSVIQNTPGLQLSKNVILVSSKGNNNNSGVIQTTGGAFQSVHSDESLSNDGADRHHPIKIEKSRREILTRRPSYRKILNDLGGSDITGDVRHTRDDTSNSESSQDASDSGIVIGGSQYPSSVVKVINANALGLSQVTTEGTVVPAGALQTITMTNAGSAAGGTIVQYAQSHDGQLFVPVGGDLQAYAIRPVSSSGSSSSSVVVAAGGSHVPEEGGNRKREIRLLKNREAARECRRKKKEYIKCLENRVAVLENQNKALIDELKSLKELYCQQKTE